jgi:hypothetical protein
MSSSVRVRDHDEDESGRSPKRLKADGTNPIVFAEADVVLQPMDSPLLKNHLPPSHALLGVPQQDLADGSLFRLTESDVGISEYVGRDVSKIDGIIKQR